MTGRQGGRIGLALACLAAATGPACAETATVTVGAARVQYDPARWSAAPGLFGGTRFSPQGAVLRKLDAVELRADVDTATSCEEAAQKVFATGYYDIWHLKPSAMTIGGRLAERFTAHTGCRNATPRGEVACVRTGGTLYLLTSVQTGCEGSNLFSGIDPLAEIADGIRFDP